MLVDIFAVMLDGCLAHYFAFEWYSECSVRPDAGEHFVAGGGNSKVAVVAGFAVDWLPVAGHFVAVAGLVGFALDVLLVAGHLVVSVALAADAILVVAAFICGCCTCCGLNPCC